MEAVRPSLYIIAGCNGAGKTTASYHVLPDLLHCKEFVNADEIAKGLSPFNVEAVAIEAGRLMLARIEYLLERYQTFAIETTLASRSYAQLVKRAKIKGYRVILLFFWLPTPEMAIDRVAKRVSEGGHNIPVDTIRRRYSAGLYNFFNIFATLVDGWLFFDNTNIPVEIANDNNVIDEEKFELIRNYVRERKGGTQE